MLQVIKQAFHNMAKGEPGTRFRGFYDRKHEQSRGSPWHKRVYTAAGVGLVLGGLILSIPPLVPGFVATIAGIRVLVAHSYFVATFLDALEMSFHCVFGEECRDS